MLLGLGETLELEDDESKKLILSASTDGSVSRSGDDLSVDTVYVKLCRASMVSWT